MAYPAARWIVDRRSRLGCAGWRRTSSLASPHAQRPTTDEARTLRGPMPMSCEIRIDFDNDHEANAVRDALELRRLVGIDAEPLARSLPNRI